MKLFSHKLLYRFDEFVASILQQMKEHENMIDAVLWNYFSDQELMQIANALRITSSALSRKKDTFFADNIINNIVPANTISSVSGNRHKKHYKKELAIAV